LKVIAEGSEGTIFPGHDAEVFKAQKKTWFFMFETILATWNQVFINRKEDFGLFRPSDYVPLMPKGKCPLRNGGCSDESLMDPFLQPPS